MQTRISVIIPTFNEENCIAACLQSLDDQSITQFEVLVVDDGSTDNTLQILTDIQIINYKLHILRQKHLGPALARNLGASYSKGNILVFIDADMTFHRDFLQELTLPIIKGELKGTFSKNEFVANWTNVWARCWTINEGWAEKKRHKANYPDEQQVFRAILTSEFVKVGGFSTGGYTDDYTLSAKLGYLAKSVPKAVFYHKNPDTLGEIFNQAKWVAKREYKKGFFGMIFAICRSTIPVSLVIGVYKSIRFRTIAFCVFKSVYDFGIFTGILEKIITGKESK